MLAVMSATMRSVSQQTFSKPPVDDDIGATYFHPCNDVSLQYVASDIRNGLQSPSYFASMSTFSLKLEFKFKC